MSQHKTARHTNAAPLSIARRHSKQVLRFGAIGFINTCIDYAIFNILLVSGMAAIGANLTSTGSAMIFSYFANKLFVFKDNRASNRRQVLLFFAITGTGVWIVQSGTLWALLHIPLLHEISEYVSRQFFGGTIRATIIDKNIAKLFATAASLLWNYSMYHFVVFEKNTRS